MTTRFYWDERTLWHGAGDYVLTSPVGGLVEPSENVGLPDAPATKRRLLNLMRVTGLWDDLDTRSAPPASGRDLARVHPESYLAQFRALSAGGGGELGPRAPFGPGGFEIAALSAGLAKAALFDVLEDRVENAYALSRPPGHHCLPEHPNGFCLLANIAIAVEAALEARLAERVAVLDWDVHHGNGTEAIFYDRDDVLTISLHQERNYPLDTGGAEDTGAGAGDGANMNVPLPPGTGHAGYLEAMERLVLPALERYEPDVIVVACGFDALAFDPLSRMLATTETFREMTRMTLDAAETLCGGRLVMAHEGGYSELSVPFAGHAVLEEMSGSAVRAPDPQAATLAARQPGPRFDAFLGRYLDELADHFGL